MARKAPPKSKRILRALAETKRAQARLVSAYAALEGTRCLSERWRVDILRMEVEQVNVALARRARRAKRRERREQ